MDFDSVLELVDDFGTYQRLMLALVLLPGFIPCGFHAYNQLFMAATPQHWCRVPGLLDPNSNLTLQQIKNISLPTEERDGQLVFSQCQMYDVRLERIEHLFRPADDDEPGLDTLMKIYDEIERNRVNNFSWPIVPCQFGWDYDRSTYISTVVTEWDVVCEYSFRPTLALVLLGFGGLVGNYVFGNIQDSLGRRPAFFIYLSIQCFFGIGTGFAFDFWSWLVMRIGVGFTVPAITGTPFVLALELVGPEKRALSTILLNIAYSLCLMGLAGVAYLVRDWRNLAFSTTLPFTVFFAYWWVLPESPRWLFAHGKLRETERILRRMAHVNGKTLPRDFRKILQDKYSVTRASTVSMTRSPESVPGSRSSSGDYSESPSQAYTVLDLLRGRVLRRNTIIITFIWFINMGVYVGLSYYAPALGGDEYLNFFLAGLAELPTYFFLYPCLDHWGRRWTLAASMILGGCACVSTILVHNEAWITLTLYCIGKFGISAGFVAIQQMAAEIYPTVVRGLGISFSNVIGMIGPTLVPLVNYTGQEYLYLPLLTLGGLMVVGGIAGLSLPETLGKSLPQTLRDAEEFKVDCSLQTCCPNEQKRSKKIYQGVPLEADGKEFSNEETAGRNSSWNSLPEEISQEKQQRGREWENTRLQQRQSTSSV